MGLIVWDSSAIWANSQNILFRYSVVTRGKTIVDVCPSEIAKNKYKNAIVFDLKNSIIIPGFIDCHSHFELTSLHKHNCFSNLFDLMIKSGKYHRNSSLCDIKKSCQIGQQMSLKNGIVYSLDWASCFLEERRYLNPETVMPMFEIIDPLGVKYKDINFNVNFNRYGLAPHSIYMVDIETLNKVFAAKKLVSIHIAETIYEKTWINTHGGPLFYHCKENSAISNINGFYENWFDLLKTSITSQGIIYVHGVHLTDYDLDSIKSQKSYLCLCPESNMALSGGG